MNEELQTPAQAGDAIKRADISRAAKRSTTQALTKLRREADERDALDLRDQQARLRADYYARQSSRQVA